MSVRQTAYFWNWFCTLLVISLCSSQALICSGSSKSKTVSHSKFKQDQNKSKQLLMDGKEQIINLPGYKKPKKVE